MFSHWPALIFGWPIAILAAIFVVAGAASARRAWWIAATICLLPFSLYLGANPSTSWGFALPVLPLLGATTSKRWPRASWVWVGALVVILCWLARLVFQSHNELEEYRIKHRKGALSGGVSRDLPQA